MTGLIGIIAGGIAVCGLLLSGLISLFGPVRVNIEKLQPGQTEEDVIKSTRRMGCIMVVLSIIMAILLISVL